MTDSEIQALGIIFSEGDYVFSLRTNRTFDAAIQEMQDENNPVH